MEKHLVVSIGDHAYMALAKGGLTPEHVMILPIAHYASSMDIPEEVEKEVSKFKSALKKCFKKRGKAVVFYERNYKCVNSSIPLLLSWVLAYSSASICMTFVGTI